MKFQLPIAMHDGLLVTDIDGQRVVIDTAAPRSIGTGLIELGDREFSLVENFLGTSIASLEELIPGRIEVLLGADVLSEFFYVSSGATMIAGILLMNTLTPLIDRAVKPRAYGRNRKGSAAKHVSALRKVS